MSIINTVLGRQGRRDAQTSSKATSITLDYPKERERVTSRTYTFRISAGLGLKQVEVSLNGGPWHPCRANSGFWWYDWQGYSPGSHVLIARGETQSGDKVISQRRQFTVKF